MKVIYLVNGLRYLIKTTGLKHVTKEKVNDVLQKVFVSEDKKKAILTILKKYSIPTDEFSHRYDNNEITS